MPVRAAMLVAPWIVLPVVVYTNRSIEAPSANVVGPPLAHTGGFDEPDCRACHEGGDLNAPGGALGVDGLPARYVPGETYEISVVLMNDDFEAAGFQGAFRIADGPRRGGRAGHLRGHNDRIVVRPDTTGLEYVHHAPSGSTVDRGARLVTWTFRWAAPADSPNVVFHVAANAANGDNSPLGDLIYTTSVHSSAR